MHIIAIEYEPSTKRGGQERSYYDILVGLKKKGHSITLAYVKNGDLIDKYKEHGIAVIQIPSINIFNKLSLREWINFLNSLFLIKNVKGATIYINQIMDLPLAAVLKKIKGAKKLVCHLRLPPLSGNLSKKRNQISLLLPCVDQFVVANKNMFEAHTQMGIPKDKTLIIPNGFSFDFSFPQKEIAHKKLKLVYLGRMDKGKGILELIESMPLIIRKWPNTTLSIAGSPMNRDQECYQVNCEEAVKKLSLDNSVRFVGHQENPIDFLRNYDITIFPSTWDEPFGRVLVESILAGVPVIGRAIGAVAEILNDSKQQWVFKNNHELCEIINRIHNYPFEQVSKFQRNNYSISNVTNNIEKLLS
ncbi:glycosyltransferase family 4 protein [Carboxylicivirga sp. RSCT41]|uniref:glycosyltransferase family 4 protein n=1 Tax=Carboxylicivirga agarovorans TaxID=3417570 RepID=UPI003D35938F